MRAVIQRVKKAVLFVEGEKKGEIGQGMMVFLGFKKNDGLGEIEYMAKKIYNLRIFEDENGKMNYPIEKVNGEVMLVPQFTLYGDVKGSNRPDFAEAEDFSKAKILFDRFIHRFQNKNFKVLCGCFGKEMLVEIHNDGPVTIIIEK